MPSKVNCRYVGVLWIRSLDKLKSFFTEGGFQWLPFAVKHRANFLPAFFLSVSLGNASLYAQSSDRASGPFLCCGIRADSGEALSRSGNTIRQDAAPKAPRKAATKSAARALWLNPGVCQLIHSNGELTYSDSSSGSTDSSATPNVPSWRRTSCRSSGRAGTREPAAIKGSGYRLVENWDFGVALKTQAEFYSQFYTRFVWENGTLDTLPSNGEWQRFRDRDNTRLEGHVLKLIAHVRNGLNDIGGIESGMMRSKKTFKYGYFEARIKVPEGRGLWPAFWLVPNDARWPPEIDIVEIVNNGHGDTRVSYHFLHPGRADKLETVTSKLNEWNGYRPGLDYKDDFHIFAVEWTQSTVKHFIDNTLVAERRFHWKHDDGSDAGMAHILFTLAVGGRWPGPPTTLCDFPAMVEIDYIRVWQK